MPEPARKFLPAAGHDWFLPLYDPLVKLLGGERPRRELLAQVAPQPGHRVLEIGCGTGSLVLLLKRLYPDVEVVGLDPDPKALARARRKAERAGVTIQLDEGFADALPYPDASLDRVLSSFMFHHLEGDAKEKTMREVRRVLRPGGTFHLLDFTGPAPGSGGLTRWLHSRHRLLENDEGRILGFMSRAGLADARKVSDGSMLVGRIASYKASAPAGPPPFDAARP